MATLKAYETIPKEKRIEIAIRATNKRRERCGGKITITEEHKENIRKARLGMKHTEETKKKLSIKTASILTPEIRKKLSDAIKSRPKRTNTKEFCEKQSVILTAALGKKVFKGCLVFCFTLSRHCEGHFLNLR